MEELQCKHRQELKEFQSRITQKRKSASKKTRKGVNDECEALERQLKDKHDCELSKLRGEPDLATNSPLPNLTFDEPDPEISLENSMSSISLSRALMKPTEQTKKPNRQKARLARRAAEKEAAATQAAEEAEELPNRRDQEHEAIRGAYILRDLKEKEIRPDGHCLYAAMADQLIDAKIDLAPNIEIGDISYNNQYAEAGYKVIRQVAASYISRHPDDFEPFLEQPLEDYITSIRDTAEWGGHLELMALAQAYRVNINVLQGDGKVEKIECSKETSAEPLWLAYYRHSFGLGEHYNSLRRAN
ncbi:hypothetical protein MMC07_005039 [Pseudocyphellaria aurata]|nr:hypothetical protein [Pseudocyphellaria aurata]